MKQKKTELEGTVVVSEQGATQQYMSSQMSVDAVVDQVAKVEELMLRVMKKDIDYGVIPGTQKPTLLKPGAEKLAFLFNYIPTVELREVSLPDDHREFHCEITLHHRHSGDHVGDGVASCSTMESRYRWRKAQRTCPDCEGETIIKGKSEYGGGWLCWQKKGGCGAKFADRDPNITEQQVGKVENPDIADVYNTVKKIAKKRALTDAILTATGASSLFTQDVEDFQEGSGPPNSPSEPLATEAQIKKVRAKINERAKATKIPADQIKQRLCDQLGIVSSKELLRADVDRALVIITKIRRNDVQKTETVPAETKNPVPLSAEPDDEPEIPNHPPTTDDEEQPAKRRAVRDDLFE